MTESNGKFDAHFVQLILSLQAAAMQQMGKIASPISGKVERNLEAARQSIDMIGMLKAKTDGNLTSKENELMEHVLYELRLNYVEEMKEAGDEHLERKGTSGQDKQETPKRPSGQGNPEEDASKKR